MPVVDRLPALTAIAENCVGRARRAGAGHADAEVTARHELAVKVRRGEIDAITDGTECTLRLRVVRDHRVATVTTTELTLVGLDRAVTTALELATLAEVDAWAGAPARSELAREPLPELGLWDASAMFLDLREARRRAVESERVAVDDPRVNHAEATCGRTLTATALATSAGFSGAYVTSYVASMVEVLAETAAKSISRYFTAARSLARLAEPSVVAHEARRRAIAALDPRALSTREVPVVFAPEAGRAILELMPRVLSASGLASSYLRDRLHQAVGSPHVTILDDALMPGGIGSRPFDAEGTRARTTVLIERGTLEAYLTTTASARQLRLPLSASAVRMRTGALATGASNLLMVPGTHRMADQIRDVHDGLYVTELVGARFATTSGDLARVATGFRIERGELAEPVSRVSLFCSLGQLLHAIDAVGDDLDGRTAFACPTFRVDALRVGTP